MTYGLWRCGTVLNCLKNPKDNGERVVPIRPYDPVAIHQSQETAFGACRHRLEYKAQIWVHISPYLAPGTRILYLHFMMEKKSAPECLPELQNIKVWNRAICNAL